MKLVLLHGFTGDESSWADVRERLDRSRTVWCPPLLGHGSTDPIVRVFTDEVDRLARLIGERGWIGAHVCGYSLGARIALGMAVRHPEIISRATMIGVNAGLEEESDSIARAQADEVFVKILEEEGIERFAAAWEEQKLFATQSAAQKEKERARRLKKNPRELARAMRILGLAAMPNYWPALPAISVPVHLIVGERDTKFLRIAEKMRSLIPSCTVTIVRGCGHNLLLEAPAVIAHEL